MSLHALAYLTCWCCRLKLVAATIQRIFVTQCATYLGSLRNCPGPAIVYVEGPIRCGSSQRRPLQKAAMASLTGTCGSATVTIHVVMA
jgi:hypothetical protein